MLKKFFIVSFLLISFFANAQEINFYPSNWFTNMKWNKVQILVRSEIPGFNHSTVQINSKNVKLLKVNKFDNENYLALDVQILPNAKPENVAIKFIGNGVSKTEFWPLKMHRSGNGTKYAQGVNSSDLIYLIMPDRFSNGDVSNDKIKGMRDQSLRRDTVFNRHGGDLKGIENHLDYLKELGVTSLWLNPVLENDMPNRTEHGYAITNHYKIDPRLGGEKAYNSLIDKVHKNGMKIIKDAVYNHVGLYHFLFQDQPDSTWFHRWPSFTQTSYKDQVLFDPYASPSDKKIMSDGWFVKEMPDWNQKNKFVENFLIQHAIWSVEEFGIDGWRIDTYAYNDLDFMNRCNEALYNEFPKITIFGETWVHGVINQAYYAENKLEIPYKSNLQATTDFQTLFYGIQAAVNEPFGWTEGVNKLYTTAAQDIIYKNPMRQVIFLDNHDLSRFYSVVNEDLKKYKLALKWLLTFRGIPQLYYGNEILMPGVTSPNDGYVRLDFPGGWSNDTINKFVASGRSINENEIFNLIKTIAHFRKNSTAITSGKMMQYVPKDGLYVYFRYDAKQTIMCVMNTDTKTRNVLLNDYSDRTKNFESAVNIENNKNLGKEFSIEPMEMIILELQK